MEDCIFCKIASGQIPCDKVYEDEFVFAFRDIHPQAPVHALVVPKAHTRDALECASRGDGLYERVMRAAVEVAKAEGLSGEGFRLVSNCGAKAGQTVMHFHVHVLGGRQLSDKMD